MLDKRFEYAQELNLLIVEEPETKSAAINLAINIKAISRMIALVEVNGFIPEPLNSEIVSVLESIAIFIKNGKSELWSKNHRLVTSDLKASLANYLGG